MGEKKKWKKNEAIIYGGLNYKKWGKKKRKNTSLILISNEKDNIEGYWKMIKNLCFISNSQVNLPKDDFHFPTFPCG